jgi:hypothetical protein
MPDKLCWNFVGIVARRLKLTPIRRRKKPNAKTRSSKEAKKKRLSKQKRNYEGYLMMPIRFLISMVHVKITVWEN